MKCLTRFICGSMLLVSLAACDAAPSTLRGAGRAAVEINQLWWFMLIVGTVIYIGVMGLLVVAYRRRRGAAQARSGESTVAPQAETATIPIDDMVTHGQPSHDRTTRSAAPGTRMVVLGGIIMPAIILTAVYAFTVETLWAISSQRTEQLPVIEVIGHQWWWEVRYPDQEFVTANEIVIPAGEPVQIRLLSEDVNHSFWVPELHGKLDMIPGRVNSFWIEAEEPDIYWGICAEFCGIQHANMYFLVIAVPPADYEAWLAAKQNPPPAPDNELAQLGRQIYADHDCGSCHAIAGTEFNGQLGPDLTNLAARRTLAAGILENNAENLAEWLLHPQTIKPGSLMPATVNVDAEELQALVVYLQTLQ